MARFSNYEESFFYRLEKFARRMRLFCQEIEVQLQSWQIEVSYPDDHGEFF